jgi:hypothetical protein
LEQEYVKSEFRMQDNVHLAMPSYDIFQTETDGSVLWRASAVTLEEAKSRVQEFAVSLPGEYIILSRPSGTKLVIGSADCAP